MVEGFTLWEGFLDPAEADVLLAQLSAEIPWERPSARLFGRTLPVPRRVAWFGAFSYTYSGIVHPAAPMPAAVAALAGRVAAQTGQPYNGVLLNRYDTGQDSMGWHADDDYDAGPHGGVASVSLGSTALRLLDV